MTTSRPALRTRQLSTRQSQANGRAAFVRELGRPQAAFFVSTLRKWSRKVDPEIGAILSNITQALTAIGVILTAISSLANRRKLERMDERIIASAVQAALAAEKAKIAAHNTDVIVAKADEVKSQIAEVREIVKNGGK